MPDNNPNRPGGDEDPKKPGDGEQSFNWRGLILMSIAVMLIVAAFTAKGDGGSFQTISWPEFVKYVNDGQVDPKKPLRLVTKEGSAEEYLIGSRNGSEEGATGFKVLVNIDFQKEELKELLSGKTEGTEGGGREGSQREPLTYTVEVDSNMLSSVLLGLLPILLILLILYFFFRQQMRMAGRGAMSFGKSKAKKMEMETNKVSFKDVAGVTEAKEEVWELVEFLKDPKKFQRLGGQIPKGVLMVGAPGTGKTLLARAIAGEADVPFFSISGSDFVEMFVGVGASRVRDMFEQGKKHAPCLIFIDEIDAVGRHRGHGLGGGHDEREQTLNALLVEMDGFDTQEGVIIIAATNRPDVLDPALLRPGRFDRQVTVALPDVKGRQAILEVHAKKVKMAESVDLGVIARGTPGYSGAELANVINEAALLAARRGLKAITLSELEESRDKVRWGKERRSLALSEKEKENTAYHEAGHAILNELLEHTDPLHKVTIIPRGPALGVTMFLPEEDKYTQRKFEMIDHLVVSMGGRVAEEIVFGDVTNGAGGDIKMATDVARKMVCQWGMSEELGMVEYGDHQEHTFLARDMTSNRSYSEDTAEKIDHEVKRLIDNAYSKAKEMLLEHKRELDLIAKALLEYETLNASHVRDLMSDGTMSDPPASPQPPDLPDAEEEKPKVIDDDYSAGNDPGLWGDEAPAGA